MYKPIAVILFLLAIIVSVNGLGLSSWSQDGTDMLPLLPANHIFRYNISQLPLHPLSATYNASIMGETTGYFKAYMPFEIMYVGSGVTDHTFLFDRVTSYRVPDYVPYPLADDFYLHIEPAGTDGKIAILNRVTRTAYEMSYLKDTDHPLGRYENGSYVAGGGIAYALSNLSVHKPLGQSPVVVSGVQQIPLMLTRADIASGAVNHALAVSIYLPSGDAYQWPASAGMVTEDPIYEDTPANEGHRYWNHSYPSHGLRMRMNASCSLAGYNTNNTMVLQGLKTYGAIFSITSGAYGVRIMGETGALSTEDNNQLTTAGKSLERCFEWVNESSLMISSSSYEVDAEGEGVTDEAPRAQFTQNKVVLVRSGLVVVNDTSTNTPTSWTWDFGDDT